MEKNFLNFILNKDLYIFIIETQYISTAKEDEKLESSLIFKSKNDIFQEMQQELNSDGFDVEMLVKDLLQ